MKIADKLVAIALSYVGVHEEGNNSGVAVEEFQKAVDGKANQESWCMCFVQFCVKKTSALVRFPDCIFDSESCLQTWAKTDIKARFNDPEPGDIVIWQKGSTALGHTGIVVEVHEDGTFDTVEGNTSSGSGDQREGDGVYRRKRSRKPMGELHLIAFLRPFPKEVFYVPFNMTYYGELTIAANSLEEAIEKAHITDQIPEPNALEYVDESFQVLHPDVEELNQRREQECDSQLS